MTKFVDLINEKTGEPLNNFRTSIETDLTKATDRLNNKDWEDEDEHEFLKGILEASNFSLTLYDTLIGNIGFDTETSMLYVGTLQAEQGKIEESKHSDFHKESMNVYYTDVLTNFYLVINSVGNILGEIKRSLGIEEEHTHSHTHEHEEACNCDHCHN